MKVCVACRVEQPRSNFYSSAGRCKPCKAKYDKQYRSLHQKDRQKYQKARRDSPEGYIDRFIERIHLRTPDTDIDRAFFQGKMGACAFTGYPFSYINRYVSYHNPTAPSIDRIDSTKGYYTWNTQVILACINRMKNDLPQEDFEQLWKALVHNG